MSSTDDIEYLDSIQRSAQLLRTCQLLYNEGTAILYKENTLGIDFMTFEKDDEEEAAHFCGVLEMYLPIPGRLIGISEETLTLPNYATPTRAISADDSGVMTSSAQRLSSQWRVLQSFARYELRIQLATQHVVFSASRLLDGLLHDKAVKFIVHMADEEEEYRLPFEEVEKTAIQMLQSCRNLRCKEITFEELNFAISPQPDSRTVEGAEGLVAEITGPNFNFTSYPYQEWTATRVQLSQFLDEDLFAAFCRIWRDEFAGVLKSAMDYDWVGYKTKLRILLEKICEDIKQTADEDRRECDTEEEIEDVLERRDARLEYLDVFFMKPCLRPHPQ